MKKSKSNCRSFLKTYIFYYSYEKDKKLLEKRRYGSILKNLALDQDLKVKNKQIDNELRQKIF